MSEQIKECPYCKQKDTELDELRNEYELFRQNYTCYKNDTFALMQKRSKEIKELNKELDRWRNMVIPLSNERDEYRDRWNAASNQIEALRNKVEVLNKNLIETTDRAVIAEVQRDEARAWARKLYRANNLQRGDIIRLREELDKRPILKIARALYEERDT